MKHMGWLSLLQPGPSPDSAAAEAAAAAGSLSPPPVTSKPALPAWLRYCSIAMTVGDKGSV